jgi:hypothetical protein
LNIKVPKWIAILLLLAVAAGAALFMLNTGNYYEELYFGDSHYLNTKIVFYQHWQIREDLDADNSVIETPNGAMDNIGIEWSGSECRLDILCTDSLTPETEIRMKFRFENGSPVYINKKITDYPKLEPSSEYKAETAPQWLTFERIDISPYSIIIAGHADDDPQEHQWALEMSDGSQLSIDDGLSNTASFDDEQAYAFGTVFRGKNAEVSAIIVDNERFNIKEL